jgi:hypothetical protein
VDTQNDFIRLVHSYANIVHSCLLLHPLQWLAITACLPADLSTHAHYPKLTSSLKAIFRDLIQQQEEGVGGKVSRVSGEEGGVPEENPSLWSQTVSTCFASFPEPESLVSKFLQARRTNTSASSRNGSGVSVLVENGDGGLGTGDPSVQVLTAGLKRLRLDLSPSVLPSQRKHEVCVYFGIH